jgi:NADPH:quinone reductase-like Zn-dependent oxidoreductase
MAIRAYTMHEVSRHPERLRRAAAFIGAGLRSGSFRSVVDRTFELDHIVDAHRHLESNAQIGKIVVTAPR